MVKHPVNASLILVTAACATFALAGCSKSPDATTAVPAASTDDAAATQAAQAEADRAAALAAKEKELSDREAAVKQQELEAQLAKITAENAALAADQKAKAAAAAAAAAKKKAPAVKPASSSTAVAKSPSPPPAPIVVPAGTQVAIALTSDLSTKTAKVGDSVQGNLQSDILVDGRKAASAGAPVSGTVTQVVSGSSKIGGMPTLGIEFNSLVATNGSNVPLGGQFLQQGKSETGRDTAKIVGGAAAGAILGHQIDHKNGSVVGGILGGAAGTAAAHKTGGEVILPAGTVVAVSTGTSFSVD